MQITVVGMGYLGVTHAVTMSKLGHQVLGIENNLDRISALENGVLPFYEPGLEIALRDELLSGRLSFAKTHDLRTNEASVHFICVGTPQKEDSLGADTRQVFTAVRELSQWLKPKCVVVGKSTVPLGTAKAIRTLLEESSSPEVRVAWNPEFLREGSALEDSLKPDRIVVGAWDSDTFAILREVYGPLIEKQVPFLEMDVDTAELVKASANAYLATKISFINAMAEIAEVSGADVGGLALALGFDKRIGNEFLEPGIGYGGGCLPKDLRSLIATAEELGAEQSIQMLKAVDSVNRRRRQRVVDMARQILGDVEGKKLAVLGVSFKPDTDDSRESPSLEVAFRLQNLGMEVVVHDPKALNQLRAKRTNIYYESDLEDALSGADLIFLGTQWQEYLDLDPFRVRELTCGREVIDGRNFLNRELWSKAGFRVHSLGKQVEVG